MIRKKIRSALNILPENIQDYIDYRYKLHCKSLYTFKNGFFIPSKAHKLRAIYIHIPKCAGTSICRTLFDIDGVGHITAKDYMNIYSEATFRDYFSFAFVRNPWDRLASAYFFLKSGGVTSEDRLFSKNHLSAYDSFESFVTQWLNAENCRAYYHFRPQMDYLSIDNKRVEVNFIGFYENLEEDFRYLAERFNIQKKLPLLNNSKEKRGRYQELYTEEMKRIVANVYADDINSLGYTFDNANISQLIALRNGKLSDKGL